eukprot:g22019.t1
MRGWQVFGLVVGIAACGFAAVRLRLEPVRILPTVTAFEPGRPFAVATNAGNATFDLNLGPDVEYTLIVSSLGEFDGDFAVSLDSEPVRHARPLEGRAIPPLTARRKAGSVFPPANARPPDAPPAEESFDTATVSQPTAARGERTFFLHVTAGSLDDPRQYARVQARLIATGRHVRVYLDDQQSERELRAGLADEIVRMFDEEIIPKSGRWLGQHRDVDGDGTFLILLSPWLSRLQGGRVSLGGFVRGSDFRRNVKPPFGNRCDMMCLNSGVVPGRNLKALLSHEFAHAIAFSERLRSPQRSYDLPAEDDWLNESIAHLSENLHDAGWSNLDHRVEKGTRTELLRRIRISAPSEARLQVTLIKSPGSNGRIERLTRTAAEPQVQSLR